MGAASLQGTSRQINIGRELKPECRKQSSAVKTSSGKNKHLQLPGKEKAFSKLNRNGEKQ